MMLNHHVYRAGVSAGPKKNGRTEKRSIRRSTGYSAKYVEGLKARNRIYLAIIVTKALALCILSIYGTGGCP